MQNFPGFFVFLPGKALNLAVFPLESGHRAVEPIFLLCKAGGPRAHTCIQAHGRLFLLLGLDFIRLDGGIFDTDSHS